jgi:iron complex outermembrane receptor protein
MNLKTCLLSAVSASTLATAPALAAEKPPNEVSEVVITGAPYAVSLDSTTTSVNIVNRAQLQAAPAVGLGDTLNGMPGLRSTFYGPGASRPIIRGLSGPRVQVLQNGVGLVDASSLSPDHAVASEPSEATRIEVLRGPATLAYGGSAIGGVVNIIDDRVPSSAAKDGPEGHLSASYGTADDSYAASANLKAGKGPWVVVVDAVKRKSQDYKAGGRAVSDILADATGETPLPGDRVLNSDVSLEAYGVGASYVGSDGYIGLSVKRTETRYGVPFPQIVFTTPPEEGPVYIDLKQTRVDFRGETGVDLGLFDQARFSVGYADYKHAEVEVASRAVGTVFRSEGAEGRVELVQRERDGWQGAVGFQGLVRDLEAIGDEAFIPPVQIDELGVFTLQRLDLESWGLEGGLRLDRRRLDASLVGRPTSAAARANGLNWATADANPSFTNVSASGAVFWRPTTDTFLSLSAARSSRAPTEFELFADGPHAGTGAYEVGDPTFRSEKVTSLELTARWENDRARAEAHVYRARYDGFIEQAPTGDMVDDAGVIDPDGELPVFLFTQSDATFYGGEIEGSYAIWQDAGRSLSLEAAYDYVHGKTNGAAIARIPPWSLTGRLVWASPRYDGQFEVRRVGEQDRVTTFELPTLGYTVVNARISYKPVEDRDLRVFLEGRNLTDQVVREHASFLKDIAPSPGRTVRVGLALNF